MPDEFQLDLEDEGQRSDHPVDKRIKNALSARDQALAEKAETERLKAEEEKKRLEAEKDRDFYKGFSQVSSKYASASEYQDKIREKVMAGYDVEDAAIAILTKEGKFNAPPTPPPPKESPAGGSAATQITTNEPKSVKDMSMAEKLQSLKDAEKRGEIGLN